MNKNIAICKNVDGTQKHDIEQKQKQYIQRDFSHTKL